MDQYTDEQLFSMSDEELEAAFRTARANGATAEEAVSDFEDVDGSEEVVDLEQPVTDSDDDTSSEDDAVKATEEDSKTEETEAEEAVETDDEKTDKVDDTEKTKEQTANSDDEVITVKADGQEYHFSLKEMKEQFGKVFGQAMNYTKKMQAIKPYRKAIDALETAGVGYDDLNLMIDALKGNKDALATVLKRTGTDALELESAEVQQYKPKDYGRGELELDIKDIVEEISSDKEYVVTQSILQRQWDNASREKFVEDPKLIKALHIDVKTGMFDTINPIKEKLKLYDGARKSDLEYYMDASRQYADNVTRYEQQVAERKRAEKEAADAEARRLSEAKAKQARIEADREASAKRKAAVPTKKTTQQSKQIDYLDMSDESFEAWYKTIQEQQ